MLGLCLVLCVSLDPVFRYNILFDKILNSHKNINLINILDLFDPFDPKACNYECFAYPWCYVVPLDPVFRYMLYELSLIFHSIASTLTTSFQNSCLVN